MNMEKKELILQSGIHQRVYEKETESDFTIPDYLANIERPVCVKARPGIAVLMFENDKATVRCPITYELLYETDYKGKLKSVSFTEEFTQKTELRRENAQQSTVRAAVPSAVCKMLTPRKVLIRSHAVCEVKSVEESAHTIVIPSPDACVRTAAMEVSRVTFCPAKEYALNETFSVGNAMPPVAEAVYVNGEVRSCLCVCSNGFVTVSGEIDSSVIYESESDGTLNSIRRRIPYSFIIDADCSSENSSATAQVDIVMLSADSAIDAYGESKDINLTCTVGAGITVYALEEETAVCDAFIPGRKSEAVTCGITYTCRSFCEKFGFTAEHLSENRNDFTSLLDSSVSARIAETREADGQTSLQTLVTARVIGTTQEGVEWSEFTAVMSEQIPVTGICDIDAVINSAAVTLTNKGISLRADGSFVCCSSGTQTLMCVCELNPGEEIKRTGAITVFFPYEGETAWEIAKRYGIEEKRLIEDNPEQFHDGTSSRDSVVIIGK